jgi:hypothetical protein
MSELSGQSPGLLSDIGIGTRKRKKASSSERSEANATHPDQDIDPSLVFTMAAVAGFVAKALSPSYYSSQWSNFLVKSHAYYHPKFRAGR